jgi:hypothetical protein
MEWQPIATAPFGLAVNSSRRVVGAALLLFVLLLARPGYSQVFDGLPRAALVCRDPCLLRSGRCLRGRQLL